jgi:hypothetical protein
MTSIHTVCVRDARTKAGSYSQPLLLLFDYVAVLMVHLSKDVRAFGSADRLAHVGVELGVSVAQHMS